MSENKVEYETAVAKFEERSTPQAAYTPMTPAELLSIAVQQNCDLAKLEKLMQLSDQWEANQAKKQYLVAFTEFKKNTLEILKDCKVSYKTDRGVTEYDHASLYNVVSTISTELGKHGIAASWKTEQGDFGIRVTCILQHVGGHSQVNALVAPPDATGKKNNIQAIASTVSYLERYTLLAITGNATKDMDDDGVSGGTDYISSEMVTEIKNQIKGTGTNLEKFLHYMKAKSIETILLADYGKAIVALEAKAKANALVERKPVVIDYLIDKLES